MQETHDLRIDLDRLDYYSSKGNKYKESEYVDLIVTHVRELLDKDSYSRELEVKGILSKEIFEKMSDQGTAQALRDIIFSDDNAIDWGYAFYSIQKNMPELKTKLR